MSKQNRHQVIIDMIKEQEIYTQEELAQALKEQGFDVTQATVSRDVRKLKLEKVQTESGKQKYTVAAAKTESDRRYLGILKEGFVSMDMAQNILVIKTISGMAMAVAAAVDNLDFPEIVGSIAGDDTIMCAIRSVEDTKVVMRKIDKLMEEA